MVPLISCSTKYEYLVTGNVDKRATASGKRKTTLENTHASINEVLKVAHKDVLYEVYVSGHDKRGVTVVEPAQ